MSTYGQIRLRLKQLAPLSIELLDGWILDRYQSILDQLEWERLEQTIAVQAVGEYATGTVTVTVGSNAVTGAGTAWTSSMSGWYFRLPGDDAYYAFTYVSATSGTLDRSYDGNQNTGSGLSYQLDQAVFALPSSVRLVSGVRDLTNDYNLNYISRAELNASAPSRAQYGDAKFWTMYLDSDSTPPTMQIEVYPIPTQLCGYAVDVTQEDTNFGPGQVSVGALPFVRPSCIVSGVQADAALWREKVTIAAAYEAKYNRYLQDMIRNEAYRVGAERVEMADHYSRHRQDRLRRGSSWTGWLGGSGPGA